MSDELWKAYSRGMAAAWKDGGLFIPVLLLRSCGELGLSEPEAMLLLQIMSFAETEGNDFPTPEQLADRIGAQVNVVGERLGKLLKNGFLTIDEYVDSGTGLQSERYNWGGWLLKAAEWQAAAQRSSKQEEPRPTARKVKTPSSDLFSVFEQEFGRLLSPIECETIGSWLDQDRYTEEIIRFALKEAVFAGKLSFRYIDRILIEWSRNRVTNADEAKAHSLKFYGGQK